MRNTKIKQIILLFTISSLFTNCNIEDVNKNPNQPISVPSELLLTGTMLADISINVSHLQRISGMWSGQYKGEIALYDALYNYEIAAAEANNTWTYLYNGILNQNKIIRENLYDDKLYTGITKVIEAHSVGTATSIWGDIPYSESISEVTNPKFDKQSDVYKAIQLLLDDAIIDLTSTSGGYSLSADIFYNGDANKWIELANTLKARYYLQVKDYAEAYKFASKGISSESGSMLYKPTGNSVGNANLLWQFVESRTGYMSVENTYLKDILTASNSKSRDNDKTTEDARQKYYYLDSGGNLVGVAGATTNMPLVTYQENQLILSETGAITVSFDEGLTHLNNLRFHLNSGDSFMKINTTDVLKYDPYTEADFMSGGIENTDNIVPLRALLREIIEERYVSGYGTFIPWNDARRLRKSDLDISVKIPLNTTSVANYPERFIISQNEINVNSNASNEISIFDVTEVNK